MSAETATCFSGGRGGHVQKQQHREAPLIITGCHSPSLVLAPGGCRARLSLTHQTLPDVVLRAGSWRGKVSNTPGNHLLRASPATEGGTGVLQQETSKGRSRFLSSRVSKPQHYGHVRLNLCCWQGVLSCQTFRSILASTHRIPVSLRPSYPQPSCDR